MTRDRASHPRRLPVPLLLVAAALTSCGPLAPARPGAAPDAAGTPAASAPAASAPDDGVAATAATGGYPGPADGSAAGSPADAYPRPDGAATARARPAAVAAALADCDAEALADHIAYAFTLRQLPGGGADVLGRSAAAEALVALACPSPGARPALEDLPAALAPVTETMRGAYNPAAVVAGERFARGWGADGRGEARLVLLRDTDGSVVFGAAEWAAAGFDAPADPSAPATRTVELTTQNGQTVDVTIPMGWHSNASSGSAAITSYLPYAWALDDDRPVKGFLPGETKVEFYGPDRDSNDSIEQRIADARYFEEEPTSVEPEPLTLPGDVPATRVRFTFAHAAWTTLYVETAAGVVFAPCGGEQAPCEAILGSVRLR